MTSLIKTCRMRETFGEYLRRLRNEQGLTLTQLAAKLDLDSANLSKIENDKRDFDEKRLEKLAKLFTLNLMELKKEFHSYYIAKKLYYSNIDEEVLMLAEEKVKYLKTKTN
jgi:HTH-type transcriptional regulator, competence development regulator